MGHEKGSRIYFLELSDPIASYKMSIASGKIYSILVSLILSGKVQEEGVKYAV